MPSAVAMPARGSSDGLCSVVGTLPGAAAAAAGVMALAAANSAAASQQPGAAAAAAAAAATCPAGSPPNILTLPLDVWEKLVGLLEASDVCRLAAVCQGAHELVRTRCRAVARARAGMRACVRELRGCMHSRRAWVARECGLQEDDMADATRGAALTRLVNLLLRSPDPMPDLAAALQQGLARVHGQATHEPRVLAPLRVDLVRCTNFVCLLAWRQRTRSRLRRTHSAAAAGGGATGGAGAGAGGSGGAGDELGAAGNAPAGAAGVQAGVQTETGPTLGELRELVTGLCELVARRGAASGRFASAPFTLPSLHLICAMLKQQLAGWNIGLEDAAGMDAPGAGAEALAVGAEAAGPAPAVIARAVVGQLIAAAVAAAAAAAAAAAGPAAVEGQYGE